MRVCTLCDSQYAPGSISLVNNVLCESVSFWTFFAMTNKLACTAILRRKAFVKKPVLGGFVNVKE